MRTSMSCGGQPAGVPTAAPVIEPQCPAVSTHLGAISVPVHRNDCPKVISATAGYAPGAASWPPTTAIDGAALSAMAAQGAARASVSRRTRVISSGTRATAKTCGRTVMRLEGIHHITAITGDAPRNLDFYTRVMGLRLTAKTVNQDDPSVYHLFYADEVGRPGSELTFFEYPGAIPGRAGAGMVHTIVSRVGSPEALDFWEQRLRDEGVSLERGDDTLRFADFEGLTHELAVRPDS